MFIQGTPVIALAGLKASEGPPWSLLEEVHVIEITLGYLESQVLVPDNNGERV